MPFTYLKKSYATEALRDAARDAHLAKRRDAYKKKKAKEVAKKKKALKAKQKRAEAKKKKQLNIKQGERVSNKKFGYEELSTEVELGEFVGGISEVLENIPDMIQMILDGDTEYNYNASDIAKVEVSGGDDDAFYASDWEPLGSFGTHLNLEDSDDWYNAVFDTKTKSYIYDNKTISVVLFVVRNPYAGGSALKVGSKKDFKNKKSVVIIDNKDDLCFGRCLVIALAKRDNHPKLKQIISGRKIQTLLTHELYEKYSIPKTVSTLDSIKTFEEKLDCSITIIDSDSFNNIIYPLVKESDYEPKDFNIYMIKDGSHFHYVNSNQVAGFFSQSYFCHKCKKTYAHKDKHKCSYKCNICCKEGCSGSKNITGWIKCEECWRNFPNQECYDNHKLNEEIKAGINKGGLKPSVCDTIFKCPDCKKVYSKDKYDMETHKCGDCWCKNCDCKINEKEGHRCFMFPKKLKEVSEKYIYFDFECSQNTGRHEVNYCIAQYHDDPTPIEFFTIDQFMEWLLDPKHKGYGVLAHNGRGYDFQFIMEYIYKKTTYKPITIYAGSKIMIMTIKDLKLRFVDSLNFLTMRLAEFPKTFGIKELKKGFFPHFFNTSENYYYKGKIPPMRYFGYNSMNTEVREEFIKFWVAKRLTNYKWDQYAEMRAYCISDVDILRRSCIIFKDLYEQIANIDPFQYTTIASVCMAIFKSQYIVSGFDLEDKEQKQQIRNQVFQDEKIAIIPFKQQDFIRKSFFGGRTNSIKLKYTFKNDEVGVYSDITSLYPAVNYYDEYPVGHPIEINENFGDITQYFGFVDCYVIPPKGLYFPVLPRKDGKLLFDLDPKRGVWTTIELNKAIEKGYKVEKVYKVLHYEKRSNTIFKEYVSTFLKIKQEASGFPAWCETESDKDKYILDYEERQGIRLDKSKIEYNAGLRAISKLCLNSLWGKFGQRLNMPKNEIISDKNRFTKIMFSDEYTGQAWNMIDEERMEIRYKIKEDYIENDFNTNIAIASFTTSHARIRLYWALEKLDRQVLYHDTDSVVYVYDKNNPDHFRITNGDLLGEWTDELDGVDMCGTFLGAGPKNYSYETTDGAYHTKIKGFTLDFKSTDKHKGLNHSSMETTIDNRDDTSYRIPIEYNMITRDKKTKIITTQPITKNYGFVYNKRTILEQGDTGDIDTLPFGY